MMQKNNSKNTPLKQRLLAFSLIDLMIFLIAISIIIAVFASAISKKPSEDSLTIVGTPPAISKKLSEDSLTIEGTSFEKCDKSENDCDIGEGLYSHTCKCESCQYYLSGKHNRECTSCKIDKDGVGICQRCNKGYFIKNGLCEPCYEGYYCSNGIDTEECPIGHYCTGHTEVPVNCSEYYHARRRSSECTRCANDEYAPAGSENCTKCSDLYGADCIRCSASSCIEANIRNNQHHLRDARLNTCADIANCEECNQNGCARCQNGYFMASSKFCQRCSAIKHCASCSHSLSSQGCSSCQAGHNPLVYFNGKHYCTQYSTSLAGYSCSYGAAYFHGLEGHTREKAVTYHSETHYAAQYSNGGIAYVSNNIKTIRGFTNYISNGITARPIWCRERRCSNKITNYACSNGGSGQIIKRQIGKITEADYPSGCGYPPQYRFAYQLVYDCEVQCYNRYSENYYPDNFICGFEYRSGPFVAVCYHKLIYSAAPAYWVTYNGYEFTAYGFAYDCIRHNPIYQVVPKPAL